MSSPILLFSDYGENNMTNMIQQATTNNAAKTNDGKTGMQLYIKQMQGEIKKALPSVITPERFTRIVLSALSTNPKLAQTTPQSFLAAMMTAAQLGVEPNTPLGQRISFRTITRIPDAANASSSLGTKDSLTSPIAAARSV